MRRRTRWVAGAAAAVAVATVLVPRAVSGRGAIPHNASFVRGLELITEHARGRVTVAPGTIGITSPMGVRVLSRVTLVDVRPYYADETVEVLAPRIVFTGHGPSPGGYRRVPGYPIGVCTTEGPWPPRTHGPTYPIDAVTLVPGEVASIVFYTRATTPGVHTIKGFRIRYRTADGKTHEATSDLAIFELHVGEPGHCAGEAWVGRYPGYPD